MQFHRIPLKREPVPAGKHRWYTIRIEGGLGGHSGVDINKGRCSAVVAAWAVLAAIYNDYDFHVASINIGEANASIASTGEIIICVPSGEAAEFVKAQEESMNKWLREEYGRQDPNIRCTITKCEPQQNVICSEAFEALMSCLEQVPQGVVKMSEVMKDTVETSNNVGRIVTEQDHIFISTHTRSFVDASDFLKLTSDTFQDVLGWRPRMVAMHFVLEAGYFVQKYPGIEIASIGPRIVEPHSTSERVELKTIDDIWQVLLEMLERLA